MILQSYLEYETITLISASVFDDVRFGASVSGCVFLVWDHGKTTC